MGWPLRPRPGARLKPEHARQKLRLWGHPVRMSCKNFLTTHQLDTHFWTEFLYTFSWQYDPSRRVCRKRALSVWLPALGFEVPQQPASGRFKPRFKGLWQRMENFSVTTVVSKAYET